THRQDVVAFAAQGKQSAGGSMNSQCDAAVGNANRPGGGPLKRDLIVVRGSHHHQTCTTRIERIRFQREAGTSFKCDGQRLGAGVVALHEASLDVDDAARFDGIRAALYAAACRGYIDVTW